MFSDSADKTQVILPTDALSRIRLIWIDETTGEQREPNVVPPIALGREYSHMPTELRGEQVARIVFENSGVSRYHALIDWEQGQLVVTDQKSVNGTFVNGQRETRSVIRSGDQVKVGPYEITVTFAPRALPPAPAFPASDETVVFTQDPNATVIGSSQPSEATIVESIQPAGLPMAQVSSNFLPLPVFTPEELSSLLQQVTAAKSTASPLAVAERYYEEIMNQANLDVIDELMSPDFLFTIPTHPEPYRGPDGFKQLVTMLHAAFPDVHLDVKHLVVDGNTVVGHWTGSGTHTGGALHTVLGDIPPSGKHFVIDGVSWLKIVDGKVVESLANEDTLSLLRQIGVIPPATVSSSPETNMAIARSYVNDIMNRGKLELIGEIIAPEFIMRLPLLPQSVRGPEALKRFVSMMRTAFPDIHYTIDREMSDNDMAAIRWNLAATHQDEFLGTPATGNSVRLQGVYIFQISGGQITEVWVNENDLGLLEQIGALPTPGE